MKRAFTLIELIGVIIILAVISIIVIPIFRNKINEQEKELSSAMTEILYNATELYVANDDSYKERDGNIYCVTINDLVLKEHLTSPVLDPVTEQELNKDNFIKVSVKSGVYEYEYTDTCTESYDRLAVSTENKFLGKEIDRTKFESITTLDNGVVPADAIESWDASETQNKSIMAWYTDNDNNGMYELYIRQNGGIIANPDSSYLFSGFTNVINMDVSKLDTSKVINMATMFYNMSNLNELDIRNFDISKVTEYTNMFSEIKNNPTITINNNIKAFIEARLSEANITANLVTS